MKIFTACPSCPEISIQVEMTNQWYYGPEIACGRCGATILHGTTSALIVSQGTTPWTNGIGETGMMSVPFSGANWTGAAPASIPVEQYTINFVPNPGSAPFPISSGPCSSPPYHVSTCTCPTCKPRTGSNSTGCQCTGATGNGGGSCGCMG